MAYHRRISVKASAFLQGLRRRYESSKNQSALLIGVHVRRTDQATWVKDMTGGGRLLRPSEILYLMGYAKTWLQQRNANGEPLLSNIYFFIYQMPQSRTDTVYAPSAPYKFK